jgi:ADP-ribose pyrophosphatase YjhB (NUDIX family)
MTRIDYLNDPNAPVPNSIVPAASAVVINDAGEILLQRRTDNDLWALPGGTMDLGERIAETVVREVREETGLDVEVTGIVGVYSDPGHVIAYSDGEVRQEFNLCFAARLVGGQLSVSDESTEVRWITPQGIEELPMHESIRLRTSTSWSTDPRRPSPDYSGTPAARIRSSVRCTAPARWS